MPFYMHVHLCIYHARYRMFPSHQRLQPASKPHPVRTASPTSLTIDWLCLFLNVT